MSEVSFKQNVLQASHQKPVVVDFWAPWCGPCQFLGPVIEELAGEQKEKWTLVKVNTDENPEISNQYKIRGIPAVKMFHRGEVIAEFTGALAKSQIERWLEENLPDERKDLVAALSKRLESGEDIRTELENFVSKNPDLDEGKILLAKTLVFTNLEKTQELIHSLNAPQKYAAKIEDLKSLIDFMSCDVGESGLADKIETARSAVLRRNFDEALKSLIQVVMIDKTFCHDMPRRATIAIFHWLGDGHELTKKYRRQFDMALY